MGLKVNKKKCGLLVLLPQDFSGVPLKSWGYWMKPIDKDTKKFIRGIPLVSSYTYLGIDIN